MGWDLGWDALVAIGTLGLAGGTGYLAWSTRELARQGAAERHARWRPMIVADRDTEVDYATNTHELLVRIQNAGTGPALYVRAGIGPTAGDAEPAQPWDAAVIRAGDAVGLVFDMAARPDSTTVLIDYLDVEDRPYSTVLEINRHAVSDGRNNFDVLKITRARLTSGGRVTAWGVPE